MKRLILIYLLTNAIIMHAQDTLVTIDGKNIPARIIKVNRQSVSFVPFSNKDAAPVMIKKKNLAILKFASGYTENINPLQTKSEKEHIAATKKMHKDIESSDSFENRYSPVHLEIPDSIPRPVSKFGYYGFLGLGKGSVYGNKYNYSGFAGNAEFTVAFRSHLFSLSANALAKTEHELNSYTKQLEANSIGLLIGESLRMQHMIFSGSIGCAYSYLNCYYSDDFPGHLSGNGGLGGPMNYVGGAGVLENYRYYGMAFPVKLNISFLCRNGFGFGFSACYTFSVFTNRSIFTTGANLVFGHWNK